MYLQESSVQNQSFSGAFTIGTSHRQPLASGGNTPAPGQYEMQQKDGKFSKIPGPRWDKSEKQGIFGSGAATPSPGMYNLNQENIGQKGHGVTMSFTPFKDLNDKFSAGPLSYKNQALKVKQKAPAFSMLDKGTDFNKNYTFMQTPGPQKYELKPFQSKKSHNTKQSGFGSGDRNAIYKNDNVKNPGVGSYNYANANKMSTVAKFPKAKRVGLEMKEVRGVPGSGAYDIDRSILSTNANSSMILNQSRSVQNSYNNKSNISKSGSQTTKNSPGPGHYELDVSKVYKTPSYRIGNSKRPDLIKNTNTPGPAYYGQIFDRKVSHADLDYFQGFGGQIRDMNNSTSQIGPGPWRYTTQNYKSISNSYQGVKINPDHSSTIPEGHEYPGPASYNTNDSTMISNRGAKFTTKYFEKRPDEIPGPGTYTVNKNKDSGNVKGYSFGTNEKDCNVQKQDIFQTSPQSYDIKSNIGALPNYMKNQRNKSHV